MNLLRSAELLLYEVVSWLVFYPLTLWRCIIRPMSMIAYAEQEMTRPPEDQFADPSVLDIDDRPHDPARHFPQ